VGPTNTGVTDWTNSYYTWTTNPVTEVAWTYDDLATLWFGAYLETGTYEFPSPPPTTSVDCTQYYMVIDYTPPGGDADNEDVQILEGSEMRRYGQPVPIWGGILATPTAVEIEMGHATQLVVRHVIAGSPGTGGYCSLECGRKLTTTVPKTIAITSIARATTVATFTMTEAHTKYDLAVGDIITVSGTSEAIFNRNFTIATLPTSTTLTVAIANSGATTATGGNIIPAVLYVPHSGEGTNIKAAATTTSYESVYLHCSPYVRLTCTITDGSHSVWVEKYI